MRCSPGGTSGNQVRTQLKSAPSERTQAQLGAAAGGAPVGSRTWRRKGKPVCLHQSAGGEAHEDLRALGGLAVGGKHMPVDDAGGADDQVDVAHALPVLHDDVRDVAQRVAPGVRAVAVAARDACALDRPRPRREHLHGIATLLIGGCAGLGPLPLVLHRLEEQDLDACDRAIGAKHAALDGAGGEVEVEALPGFPSAGFTANGSSR